MKLFTPLEFLQKILLITVWVTPLLPAYLFAQMVSVGSGSYTTQLPPPDAAGRNRLPNGTPRISGAAATKPIPTSDWVTNV